MGDEVVGRMQIQTTLDDSEMKKGLSGLKRDLKVADNQMKKNLSSFDMSDKSAKKLGVQVDSLSGKYKAQEKVVGASREKYERLKEEKGENAAATQNARIALEKEEAALGNTGRQLDNVSKELAELQKQQKAAESGWGKFGTKMTGMGKNFQTVGSGMTSVGKTFTKATAGMAAGLAGLGGSLYGLTSKVTETADGVAKGAEKVGVSSDAYQELDYWASQNGLSQGDMEKAVGRLNQRVGLAAEGNEKYASALENLGVDLEGVKNGTVSTEDAMATSLKTLSEMENEQQKSAAASELFGTKMSRELMPALNEGSLSFEDAKEKAEELGLVIGSDQLSAAEKFQDAQDDIKRALGAVAAEIGLEMMPHFQKMQEWIIAHLPQIKETIMDTFNTAVSVVSSLVKGFMDLSPTMRKVLIGAAALATTLGPVLMILGQLTSAIGTGMVVMGSLSTAIASAGGAAAFFGGIMSSVILPVAAFTAAIAALVAGGILLYKNWDKITATASSLWESMKQLGSNIKAVAGYFAFVITEGDYMNDWLMGMPEKWRQPFITMGRIVGSFRDDLFVFFNDITSLFDDGLAGLPENIANLFKNSFSKTREAVILALGDFPQWVSEGVSKSLASAGEVISNIGKTIADKIGNAMGSKAQSVFQTFFDQLKFAFSNVGGIISMVTPFITGFGLALAGISGPIGIVIGAIVSFGAALYRLYNTNETARRIINNAWASIKEGISLVIQELKPIFDVFMQSFAEMKRELGPEFQKTWQVMKASFRDIQPVIQELGGTFQELGATIFPVIKELIGVWVEFQKLIWSTVAELAQQILPILLDAVKQIFPLILDVIRSVLPIVVDLLKTVVSIIMEIVQSVLPILLDVVKQIFPVVLQIIESVLPIITNLLKIVIGIVLELVKQVLPILLQVVETIFPIILKVVEAVIPVVADLLTAVIKVVLKIVQTVLPALLKIVEAVFPIILQVIEAAIPIVEMILNRLISVIENVLIPAIEFILEIVQLVFPKIANIIENILNIVIGIVQGFIALFTGDWKGLKNSLETISQSAMNILKNIFQLGVDLIKLVVSKFVDGVVAIWNSLWNKTKSIFRSIKNFLSEIWSNIVDAVRNKIYNMWINLQMRWRRIQAFTRQLFRAVRDFLSEIWSNIRDKVSEFAQKLWDNVRGTWVTARENTKTIFRNIRDFLLGLWRKVRDTIVSIAQNLWDKLKGKWNFLKNTTQEIFRSIRDFLLDLWRKVRDTVVEIAQNLWDKLKGKWNFLSEGTKDIFRNVRDWLSSLWSKLRDKVTGFAEDIFDNVKSAWNKLWDNTKEIFNDIKDWVKEKFDDVVDMATGLPERMGKGISSMAGKLTSKVTNLINSVGQILEDGVNFVIGGVNWVINKLGGDGNTIGEFSIPKVGGSGSKGVSPGAYAQGTDNHPGGAAWLGDGKGSNAGSELIGTPDGKLHMSPSKPTLMDLPKGSSVLSAKDTKMAMGGTPKYAFGIGWIKDRFQDAKQAVASTKETISGWGSNVKNKLSSGLDRLKDVPGDFYDKWSGGNLLGKVMKEMGLPTINGIAGGQDIWSDDRESIGNDGIASLPGRIIDQAFSKVMSLGNSAIQSALPKFDTSDGRPDFGPQFIRSGGFGKVKSAENGDYGSRENGDGTRQHNGIDFLAPYGTPVKAQANGKVVKIYPENGQIDIQKGNRKYQYAHNSEIMKQVGDQVEKGEVIAKVGSKSSFRDSGRSHAHVHYGVMENGKPIDPDTLGGGYAEPETLYDGSATGFTGIGFGKGFRKTSGFGPRSSPGGIGSTNHRGMDYAATYGTPIKSQSDGIVDQVKRTAGLGKQVWVKNGGYKFVYGHMSKQRVKEGDNVNRGDVLGNVGSTGRSTGPHVHFGVRKDGSYINPKDAIQQDYEGSNKANVKRWISAAIKKTGVSKSWQKGLETIAMKESGGNPLARNDWDINAKNGIPSQGLMQTIPPTFNAHNEKGWDSILNGKHNAAAAINYIKSRYGSIDDVPGLKAMRNGNSYVGYADGGIIEKPHLAMVGEGGWNESIISHDPSKKNRSRKIWEQTGQDLGFANAATGDMAKLLALVSKAIDQKKATDQKNREHDAKYERQKLKQGDKILAESKLTNQLLMKLLGKDTSIQINRKEIARAVNSENALDGLGRM